MPLQRLYPYRLFFIVTLSILFADQLTKLWVAAYDRLPLHQPPYFLSYWPEGGIEVIPNFFYLCHIGNEGAAWGILAGYGFWLIILAILALVVIYRYRRCLALKQPFMQVSFGLLCGGIVGNLIDRIFHGHVIDFLDVHLPFYRWPAFNIADMGITLGLFLYLVTSFWLNQTSKRCQAE